VLPSRKVVSHTLTPEIYDQTKLDIKAGLPLSNVHALITDMLTSASNISFMGVTTLD